MGRPCQYPHCKGMLSEHVPGYINLCGNHQYVLIQLRHNLDCDLPGKDLIFIACHKQGCNAKELARHLEITEALILKRLKSDKIKGQRKQVSRNSYHPIWVIPIEEIVRVIDLARNWITIRPAAKIAGVARSTLFSYIQAGHFGKIQPGFSGKPAIHRRMLVGIAKKCRGIKQVNEKQRIAPRDYLSPGEIQPRDLAKILGISPYTVYHWLQRGKLPTIKRQGRWIITKNNIRALVVKSLAGESKIDQSLIEKLQELTR